MKDLLSERLWLRSPDPDDAPFIARLMSSNGYLQNIGERGVKSADDALGYLQSAPIYDRQNGMGFNIVELLATGEPIGICGLVKRDAYESPDVGYAFLDEFGGKGFATEATARVVEHAFSELGLPELLAITSPVNAASARVLEKLGFTLLNTTEDQVCVYRLASPLLIEQEASSE